MTFSATILTGFEFHASECTMGTGSILGVRAVFFFDPQNPSRSEAKETIELNLYKPLENRALS
jgi:hypothetical protein